MNRQRFSSVWDALEDTPGQAANMKLRFSQGSRTWKDS